MTAPAAPVIRAFGQDRANDAMPDRRSQTQVDEAGPGDLGQGDVGIGAQALGEAGGKLARIEAGRPGKPVG